MKIEKSVKTFKILRYWQFAIILAILVAAFVGFIRLHGTGQNKEFNMEDHLDDVAVTVDGEDLTVRDIMFYITYEEYTFEQQAKIYNKDNTTAYWNLHANGVFIRLEAKEDALGMAVHDHIFAKKAEEMELVLSANDLENLDYTQSDFWDDIDDEQKENLEKYGVTQDMLNDSMEQVAMAEKYQEKLQKEAGGDYDYDDYDYDGYAYEQILKKEHKVVENDELWDEISMGNITYTHGEEYNR